MGSVTQLWDRLSNALTGTGTRRDPRTAYHYEARPLTQHEIAAAYSGSGLLRKIVQIPALDMVREWRDWGGLDDVQAAKVWDEEKRLCLRQKVRQAEQLRAMGGGALILGLPGVPSETAPERITAGQLAFVHVVSRWHLTFDVLQDDAREPGYGEPLLWHCDGVNGRQSLHPSRVIAFRADATAAMAMTGGWGAEDAFWGESVVQQVLDAVKDNDAARAAFGALLHKARSLRIGIPRLMETSSSAEGTAQLQKRMGILQMAEGIHNAVIYDAGDDEGKGGETVTDSAYSFAGAKDMLNAYAEFVAAISDIPATRLLGRAPEGMNSSGDSQQRDWNKRVRAMQTLELAPCLDRLDRYLVQSACGSAIPTASNDFAPLDTPSEKERADVWKVQMEAVEKLIGSATVPDRAIARGVQSLMVAEGYLPELEAALAAMSDEERYGLEPEGEEVIGGLAGAGGVEGSAPLRRAANDAAPRPLYVHRKLLNGEDVVRWAKAQGFTTTLDATDMHVTILYSRTPVDPMKMGEGWVNQEDGGLTIKAGGPRVLEKFDGGAVVLQFASWSLRSRHAEMIEAGASHDYREYLPHVTITYQVPDGLDIDAITPFVGELRFGPEIFEALNEDWKNGVEET